MDATSRPTRTFARRARAGKEARPRHAAVGYHESRTDAGAGLAALRNGQRSAWQALPRAQIGSVLIPDEAVATISTMIEVLLALDNALPDRFVPTAGIEPVDLSGWARAAISQATRPRCRWQPPATFARRGGITDGP